MLKNTFLAGLACVIGLTAPAFGQGMSPQGGVGGAIGGTTILGTTRYDNAPLWAAYTDRSAHVSGNYKNALAKFDRVIRPDGSVMVMRRISPPWNPNDFAYLPTSWPAVGALATERVMDTGGNVVSQREVIISQYQIMNAGIPTNGPQVATLSFDRNIMPDGRTVVVASAQPADPGVAVALAEPALRQGAPWQVGSSSVAVASR
jgi:hypothetical protein